MVAALAEKPPKIFNTLMDNIPCKWQACTRSFTQKGEMIPHVSNSHLQANQIGNSPSLNCKWQQCDLRFPSYNALLEHIGSHHLEFVDIKPNVCLWKKCGGQFDTFDSLTAHATAQHVGTGKTEYVCYWYGCLRNGKPFMQRPGMVRHLQTRLLQLI